MFSNLIEACRRALKRSPLQSTSDRYWSSLGSYDYKTLCPRRYEAQLKYGTEEVLPRITSTDSILEIACGDGWFTHFIAPHCKDILAFDLSEKLLSIARTESQRLDLTNVKYVCQDAGNISLEGHSFNHAMVMGLFTYIPDNSELQRILSNIRASLRPGGFLFIKESLTDGEEWTLRQPDYAAHYRNKAAYLQLISGVGFELVSATELDSSTGGANVGSSAFVFQKR